MKLTRRQTAALAIVCPLCRAGAGQPCLKLTATNNYWDKHPAKYPHRARVDKAAGDDPPEKGNEE